jgi:hypothetical protein
MNRRLRAVVLGLLSLVLVWQVIARTLVAYLAEAAPQTALRLSPNDAQALSNLADRVFTPRWSQKQKEKEKQRAKANADESGDAPADTGAPDETNGRLGAWASVALKVDEANTPENGADLGSLSDEEIIERVRSWAEAAVVNDPFNARALRILGQLADEAGDKKRAAMLMEAATARSKHESLAVYWLLQNSLEQGDFAAVISHADVLLRTRPEFADQIVAALARMAERPGGAEPIKEILARNPPWRGQFFKTVARGITDARTPLDLLLSLRDAENPPSVAELKPYIDFLIGHRFYELAHYTWLQFLPLDQLSSTGLIFNNRFQLTPSGLPFDWVIRPGAGVTADITARPDQKGARALLVEFGLGRVDFPGVAQLMMLPPGRYQLSGKHKGQITGRRGLKWRVTCAGSTAPIAESPMLIGQVPDWKVYEFPITVPAADCPAQVLRLELDARSASERLVSGSMWFDELRLTRNIDESE